MSTLTIQVPVYQLILLINQAINPFLKALISVLILEPQLTKRHFFTNYMYQSKPL